jgi:hypothetical protein
MKGLDRTFLVYLYILTDGFLYSPVVIYSD